MEWGTSLRLALPAIRAKIFNAEYAEDSQRAQGLGYFGYWNEYPLASVPDMNLVLYSSR